MPSRGHQAASLAPASPSQNLSFGGGIGGGGVTTGPPKVYVVFWGSQWGAEGTDTNGYLTLSGDPDGVAPYLQAFIKGIGTDGEKENNNLDMLEEMKFASLLQKVSTLDPTAGDPWDVLDMATLSGARVLGLDAVTGSLEPGKRADVVTVDLGKLHTTPVLHGDDFNVVAHLVFSSAAADVDHVLVDGRLLVDGGRVVSVDVEDVRARGQAAAEELFRRRAALPAG